MVKKNQVGKNEMVEFGLMESLFAYEREKGVINNSLKRENLERTLNRALELNAMQKNNFSIKKVDFARTGSDLLDIMRVRSVAYKQVGNDVELSDPLPGLNYDSFDDGRALILKYSQDNRIIGTSRLILDSRKGLFSEKQYDELNGFDNLRIESNSRAGKRIAELSRTCIHPEYQGSMAFKHLMASIYELCENFNVGTLITTVRDYDTSMYTRFGMEVIKSIDYGEITDCEVLSWKIPEDVSKLFYKGVLGRKFN